MFSVSGTEFLFLADVHQTAFCVENAVCGSGMFGEKTRERGGVMALGSRMDDLPLVDGVG